MQVGESVEGRYTADDKWYKAVILQIIHGGFEIARWKLNLAALTAHEVILRPRSIFSDIVCSTPFHP